MRKSTAIALGAIVLGAIAVRLAPLWSFLYWGSDTAEYFSILRNVVRTGHVSLLPGRILPAGGPRGARRPRPSDGPQPPGARDRRVGRVADVPPGGPDREGRPHRVVRRGVPGRGDPARVHDRALGASDPRGRPCPDRAGPVPAPPHGPTGHGAAPARLGGAHPNPPPLAVLLHPDGPGRARHPRVRATVARGRGIEPAGHLRRRPDRQDVRV